VELLSQLSGPRVEAEEDDEGLPRSPARNDDADGSEAGVELLSQLSEPRAMAEDNDNALVERPAPEGMDSSFFLRLYFNPF